MKNATKLFRLAVAAATVFAVCACQYPSSPQGGNGNRFVPVENVEVNADSLLLHVGQGRSLTATVYPPNATTPDVWWTSGDPSVASVNSVTGNVTANSTGTATITVTTKDGGRTASSTVRVMTPTLPSLRLSIAPWPYELDRNIWRSSTVSLDGTGPYEDFAFGNVTVQARGRGNSSWHAMGYKRPLRIRFFAGEARSMFGSGFAARDWPLLANAIDHSMMRNYSAYLLGRLLSGMDFAPTGHFLHLYMGGDYRGVYMLSDQMQVHPGRIELTHNSVPERSEFFFEMCRRAHGDNEHDFAVQNVPFVIEFPDGANLTQGHRQFLESFIANMDAALAGGNFDAISGIIDVPSFVDFYLVQELFKNQDVDWSSLNFQIRQTEAGPRMFAGPLWDFDLSSGSSAYPTYDRSPLGAWAATRKRYFRLLMDAEWFRELVGARWIEIRGGEVAAMTARVEYLARKYRACFERNFERWPDKNVWVTPPELRHLPFAEQVEFLLDWLERRKVWMDGFLQP